MSEVLFGQSYYLRLDPKLWAAMQPYPPLGTMYAASYVRSRGYDVALFDAMLSEGEREWDASLARERPRFAVLYEDNFNYLSKMCLLRMRRAAFTMIEMARRRGCTVVVCGSDATDHAEDYLARGAHYVLLGEGELTLGELLDRLTGRPHPLTPLPGGEGVSCLPSPSRGGVGGEVPFPSPPRWRRAGGEAIQGLAFVDKASGSVIRTPHRPDIRDLDSLPFPAWDLVDVQRYREIWRRRHGYFSMNAVTTRGCPYHCNWCAKPIWGQRYNSRSPENVVAELRWLKDSYAPDHLWFADDIMGLKPGWLQRFADLVEERGARISFKSLHRVDLLLRGDTVEALRRVGAQTVWVGAESGSQKILDAMEKGTRVEQIYEARRRLGEAGIRVGFFVQFGYPGEGRAEIEQTLQMLRDCRPDDVGMSVSYPLPGTTFYANVQSQLATKRNWTDSDDLAMLYEGPYGTPFYRKLHTVVHTEFRMRNAWDQVRAALRRPTSLRTRHLRSVASLAYHAVKLPVVRAQLDRLERAGRPGDAARTPGPVADPAT